MTVITNQMWLFYKNASHLNQGRKMGGGGLHNKLNHVKYPKIQDIFEQAVMRPFYSNCALFFI